MLFIKQGNSGHNMQTDSIRANTIVKFVTLDYIHVKRLSLNSGNFTSAENKKIAIFPPIFSVF